MPSLEKHNLSFHDVARIWRSVLWQSAVFIAVFVSLSRLEYFTNSLADFGVVTFGLGLVSIIPSLYVLVRFHRLRRRIRAKFQEINTQFVLLGDDAEKLKRYMTRGIVLADLTLIIGVGHLVITGNLVEAIYFWGIALFFCLNYKPCVRFIDCSAGKVSNKGS